MVANAFNLGTAYGRIILDTSGVDAGVERAKRGLGDGLRSIGGSISDIGASLTALTAPVAAFGLTGLKAASDFDSVMNQVRIFGNLAPADLEKARQAALQFGADTQFSALDASNAMLDLLKSGQDVTQVMETMPSVLSLAAAGNISLAQASSIVTAGLTQYGLKASDAARVSNALARAANASQADVAELGQGLANVGPIAAQFGLSIEDTSAILAVFRNNGIQGAEAGTQLKSMLLNLARPTDDVKAAFAELGVSLYDNQGNVRDFNTVLVEMDAALDKLPVQQQNELMQTLAGSYGITGLNALRASGGIDDMRAAMEASPDAAKTAEEQMKTFEGSVESLMGSIQSLQIHALTPLMNEAIAPLVRQITGVVNSISLWIQENPALAGQIVRVIAAVAAIGPVLLVVGKAISAVGSLVSGLGSVFGLLLSPIGLVIGAVGLLVAAFVTDFGGLRTQLMPVIEEFVGYLGTLWEQARPGLEALANWFINDALPTVVNFISGTVIPVLVTLADWFLNDALPAIIGFIQTAVIPAFQSWFSFLGQLWAIVGPHLEQFANWFINEALPSILNFITGTVIPIIGQFVRVLTDVWNAVAPHLLAFADWFLNTGLPFIVTAVQWFIDNVWNPAMTALGQLWILIQPVLEQFYNWFITEGLPFINEALTWFKDNIMQPVIDLLVGVWDSVGPALSDLFDWFITDGLPFINEALTWFKDNVIQPVIDLLVGIWASVGPGLETFKNEITKIFTWINDNVIQPAKTAFEQLLALLGSGTSTNPANGAGPAANAANIASYLAALAFPGNAGGGGLYQPTGYATGLDVVPEEGLYRLHPGEGVLTATQNAARRSGGGEGNGSININGVTINANSFAEGQAAAMGFESKLRELIDARGG